MLYCAKRLMFSFEKKRWCVFLRTTFDISACLLIAYNPRAFKP